MGICGRCVNVADIFALTYRGIGGSLLAVLIIACLCDGDGTIPYHHGGGDCTAIIVLYGMRFRRRISGFMANILYFISSLPWPLLPPPLPSLLVAQHPSYPQTSPHPSKPHSSTQTAPSSPPPHTPTPRPHHAQSRIRHHHPNPPAAPAAPAARAAR